MRLASAALAISPPMALAAQALKTADPADRIGLAQRQRRLAGRRGRFNVLTGRRGRARRHRAMVAEDGFMRRYRFGDLADQPAELTDLAASGPACAALSMDAASSRVSMAATLARHFGRPGATGRRCRSTRSAIWSPRSVRSCNRVVIVL